MSLWNWLKGTLSDVDRRHGDADARSTAPGALKGRAALEEGFETEEAPRWWIPPDPQVTEPVFPKPTLKSRQTQEIKDHLITFFNEHNLALPILPRIPNLVLQRLHQLDCDYGEVADILAEDQVVVASVLGMANSPLYRGGQKITSLQVAITRLGVRALRTLMMHQSLRAVTFNARCVDPKRAQKIWARSLSGAWIARGLAGLVGMEVEEAFLVGLVHDIGNVVTLGLVGAHEIESRRRIDEDAFEYLCFTTHQKFGELVARSWELPENIGWVIADHHHPPKRDDPYRLEKRLIQLADMIASLLNFTPRVNYDLLNCGPAKDLGLSSRERFIPFLDALPEALKEHMASF